jgi:hypothetical protein
MHGKSGMHGVEKNYTQKFEREAKGKGKTLSAYIQGPAEKPNDY